MTPAEKPDRRSSHLVLSERLRRGISSGELIIRYHPIHDISTGRVVSAEALMRWSRNASRHDSIEALADAAERGDAAFDLAEWVARQGHEDAQVWRRADASVRLNLNVSARYLGERDLLAFVDSLIGRGLMDPDNVNLEVTEKSFVRRPDAVTDMLAEVKERGAQLWLDDFGTGHSSIEHLRYFPVDGLKIPGTYTRDIVENRRSLAVCQGIVAFAKQLEIRVVAEGIETEEQLELMRRIGCDEIQGYVFSKPMSADELAKLAGS